MDNQDAQMHYLTEDERIFFTHKCKEISDKITSICQEHGLQGRWGIGENFQWIVRVGE
jgi:hypothetical protein